MSTADNFNVHEIIHVQPMQQHFALQLLNEVAVFSSPWLPLAGSRCGNAKQGLAFNACGGPASSHTSIEGLSASKAVQAKGSE